MEGVEQGAEIGVDLGLHVSGEESEAFASLDRRADQNDAFNPSLLKSGHSHGHS